MAEITSNVFNTLFKIDLSEKVREKNGLSYLSWATAWAEIKKNYPNATYKIYPQIMDEFGNTRFWHDDGKSGWVQVGVTIDGIEQIEVLAIMDFKNQALPVEKITSVEANRQSKDVLLRLVLCTDFLYIFTRAKILQNQPQEQRN